jgi:hypothetical protein
MRFSRFGLVLGVVAIFLSAATARAGWFNRKDKQEGAGGEAGSTRRYHLHVPDKNTEQELLRLFSWKRTVTVQLQVLQQLASEKQQELATFSKGLKDKFSIEPDRNYDYDSQARTLYEMVPRAAGATNQAGSFDRKTHLELKGEDQVRQYIQLASGRKLAFEEMRVFQAVLVEKQAEMNRVDQTLSEKFSVSRERNYEYDPKTRRLYELVAPEKKSAPAVNKTPSTTIPLRSGTAPTL